MFATTELFSGFTHGGVDGHDRNYNEELARIPGIDSGTVTWLESWMLWNWPMRRTASLLLSDIAKKRMGGNLLRNESQKTHSFSS